MASSHTRFKSVSLLLIRLAFGFRLIYGTIDNVISWEQMLEFESFLQANGFPLPLVSAILSVYLQFLAGICWIMGFQVRIASMVMCGNFLVALMGVHLVNGDTYLALAPALHLLVIALLLWALGPGKISLDHRLGRLNA